MLFHSLGFLSSLAYLALCLLIAASRAGKKYQRGGELTDVTDASTIRQLTGESGRQSSPFLSPTVLLFMSGLISLISFLFLPCGTLPSLFPVSGSALLVLGGLALALGFRCIRCMSGGWNVLRRQCWTPLCLGISLAVIARYAQQRGVPGDLHTLDAYVSMPIIGAAEGVGKLGVGVLAAASLLALWDAAGQVFSERKPADAGETLFAALVAELWMLAAIGFWVCLFFPFSFTYSPDSEVASLVGVALNALFFWGKVLGLEWVLGKQQGKWQEKFPRGIPFYGLILFMLSSFGAWLLLGVAAE
jgi:hypothetical protein